MLFLKLIKLKKEKIKVNIEKLLKLLKLFILWNKVLRVFK